MVFGSNGPVGLAMRRLSIIDLSTGHQPMWCPAERFVIVFNGEVYNYREIRRCLESLGHIFRTNSDTEVILLGYREWGPRVLDRMVGMWGLAIYDTQRRELFLARDRLGKKQIYYGVTSRFLVFGSEMAVPILFSPEFRRLNKDAVPEFLRHGYVGRRSRGVGESRRSSRGPLGACRSEWANNAAGVLERSDAVHRASCRQPRSRPPRHATRSS